MIGAEDAAALWKHTHRFASPLRARVLAYEAARSRGGEQLAHLVAVCQAIQWLEPIHDAADIVGTACRPPSLQLRQGLGSLLIARKYRGAHKDAAAVDPDDDATAVAVNVDRFFLLPHPCAKLWAALDRRQGRHRHDDKRSSGCCERCGTKMRSAASTAVLFLCSKCYRYLLHEVLAPSRPRDFGSLRYWEQEHLESGRSEAGEDTSDEWFLAWEELERPLGEVWARHLSFGGEKEEEEGGGMVALVPGNGRSVIAERLARQTNVNASPASTAPVFGEVVATDAAKGITEAMADRSSSSSSSGGRCARLRYLQDDIRRSSMASSSVHCILDKGLLDALACSFDGDHDDHDGDNESDGGQQQQQWSDEEEKHGKDGSASSPPPPPPLRQGGTRDERKAVAEYARLLRGGGLLVLNTGRTRSSALAPFSLEAHRRSSNSQQRQQRQQQGGIFCRWWELLEERRFVAISSDENGGSDGVMGVAEQQPETNKAAASECLLFVLRLHRAMRYAVS